MPEITFTQWCDPADPPPVGLAQGPPSVRDMCEATLSFLSENSSAPPFSCCHIALLDGIAAGGGGFVSAPYAGRVEIAYFTAPEFERRGVAGALAAYLVELARSGDAALTVFAKTLPTPSPSSKILERLGFAHAGIVQDHEIGDAWLWELPPASG